MSSVMEPRISIITLGVANLERSYDFYYKALGFPTSGCPQAGIIFFKLQGVCLALYPKNALAEDANHSSLSAQSGFSGITLAHNTKEKFEVDKILRIAEQAGATIVKPAQATFWGGYSGYFTDPDGHYWEIAYSDDWKFNSDGSLVID